MKKLYTSYFNVCLTLLSFLGLDWSEDSDDNYEHDEDDEAERFLPFYSSWRPLNG